MQKLKLPDGSFVYFTGPSASSGPLPALLYFALSGEESLALAPYNRPAKALENSPLRVFSFDIPAHGEGQNKFQAMEVWATWFEKGISFFPPFFEHVLTTLDYLIEQKIIDPDHIGVAGLSRGGFIATHLAALDTRIKTVLGFAPLTRLHGIKEFQDKDSFAKFEHLIDAFDLVHLCEKLLHLKHLRYYIGARDVRVFTDACYQFIRSLADTAHNNRVRTVSTELFISPSIGFKGHGTAPHIFEEGSFWIKEKLCQ